MTDHRAAMEMAYRSAEAHFAALKREMGENGQPCRTCRWAKDGAYSWDRVCRHPFLKRGDYNGITGVTRWTHPSHEDARRTNCTQAGVLHEPAGWHVMAWRWGKRNHLPFALMLSSPVIAMWGAIIFR